MAKEPKNCWDFFKCKAKEKCPAYQNDAGRECWFIASSFCQSNGCPKVKRSMSNCAECPWFKKLNPDFDEKGFE